MENFKNALLIILILVSLFLCAFIIYQHNNSGSPDETKIALKDTITLYNTVRDTVILEKTKFITKYDTIIVRDITVNDSVHQVISDTIHIPIEHKTAEFNIDKDSLKLHQTIYYLGFKALIDSITTDYSFNYTIKPLKLKKFGLVWAVGPYVGYGYQFNNGKYTNGFEVGIGASIGIGGYIK